MLDAHGLTRVIAAALGLTTASCLVSFDASLIARDGRPADEAVPDSGAPDTAKPADGPPADAPCGDPSCDGERLVGCGGTIAECPLGCVAAPSPHCRGFTPSNGVPAPSIGLTGEVSIDRKAVLDACTGKLDGEPLSAFVSVEQPDGPTIGVLLVRSLQVASGADLLVVGNCALAVVAGQRIEIAGQLDLRGGQNTPYAQGPGGAAGAFFAAAGGCGAGDDGDPRAGGGGGALGSPGGAGGAAAETPGAAGGEPCANEELTPLVGGSGGGRGRCSGGPCPAGGQGSGGGGGGALALVAGERVELAAGTAINLGGGGGEGGIADVGGGGGGGSGGSILVEAPIVVAASDVRITAAGGGGGGVAAELAGTRGQRPGFGPAPAPGGSGMAPGGDGATTNTPAQPGEDGTSGGGGGGGGLGRVRVNSRDGAVDLPPVNAVATQGQLVPGE